MKTFMEGFTPWGHENSQNKKNTLKEQMPKLVYKNIVYNFLDWLGFLLLSELVVHHIYRGLKYTFLFFLIS